MYRITLSFLILLLASAATAQITPIADIQFVQDPVNDDTSPMVGQTVTIQGRVTFEPMSRNGNQFTVADASGAWNGIHVYTGDTAYHLGFGWEVEITGEVQEYYGLTQINAETGSVTVLNDHPDAEAFWSDWYNNTFPELTYTSIANAGDLSTPLTAEAYEGTLVRVETVTASELPNDFGEWDVADDLGTVAIDNPASDMYGYKHWVLENQPYVRIQGILNYSFSEYKILPEIAWDLEVDADPMAGFYDQIPYIQQVRPMDMTLRTDMNDESFLWDASYASRVRYGLNQGGGDPYGEDIVLHTIITYPTELGYAGDGAKFIMTDWLVDGEHEPWTSVLSYNPEPGIYGELYLGDEIVFHGEAGEYPTGPSSMTEVWITDSFEFVSEGNPLPVSASVTVEDLRDPMRAEMWGNSNVELTNVIVADDAPTPYELFAVDSDLNDNIGPVKIDDDSDAMSDYPDPPEGAMIYSLSGWVYHHFGVLDDDVNNLDWVYKVCPLYPDDIVVGPNNPPHISTVSRNMPEVMPNQVVSIIATVFDLNIDEVVLHWRTGFNGPFNETVMSAPGPDNAYVGEIPGQPADTDVWYYVTAEDDDGQSDVFPDEAPTNLLGYWARTQLSLPHVQFTISGDGNSPYNQHVVNDIVGVVVNNNLSAEQFGNGTYGPAVFLQSMSPVDGWDGLLVHTGVPLGLQIGDRVRVDGMVDETGLGWEWKWGTNTRIPEPDAIDVIGTNMDVTTNEVTLAQLAGDPEAWESSFVRVDGLTVVALNQYDITVTDGNAEFLIDDDLAPVGDPYHDWYDNLTPGSGIDWLRGLVTYTFGTWKIEPRDILDVGAGVPFSVDIEPDTSQVVLPPGGGTFTVDIEVTTPSPMQVDAWTQVTHLGSGNSIITNLFENVGLPGGQTVTSLNQAVPAFAPGGNYAYTLYLGDAPWVPQVWDSFEFFKTGDGPMVAGEDWTDADHWPSRGSFGTPVAGVGTGLPTVYAMHAPYPNPFNPTTTVTVALPRASELTVTVYNVAGQTIAELASGSFGPGEQRFVFDASSLSSGLYFVRATVPGELNTVRKLMLVR